MKAKDIMERNVLAIKKDVFVKDIAKIMFDNKISGLPVVDDENKVIGVVTEKDLFLKEKESTFPAYIEFLGSLLFSEEIKKYDEELKKLSQTTAEEIMTREVHTITEDATIEEIANIMVNKNVNRVPVVDKGGRIVGIVSRADMLKTII
ncbi:MAG TPA: CBS domain-containing protein [Defluviitaleaceae bacterium]|nr:CBS domain-containing protein [Defluviitaleaceae bacterium]